MLGEEKNLKDSQKDLKDTSSSIPAPYQTAGLGSGSYTKTHKLITALYMVTDIMDKDEPLRSKLRTLGAEIISDTYYTPHNACVKISEVMSFLDIAFAINIISEMNCGILRKEFLELDQSIKEWSGKSGIVNRQINLSEFLKDELSLQRIPLGKSIGHHSTRIGVQKGSTLMEALSGVGAPASPIGRPDTKSHTGRVNNFDVLKQSRRNNIIAYIQKNGGNATITDIKNGAYESLASCGEKTLQRELISMVKDGVLNKTGEKRWSRYALPTPNAQS